MASTLVHDRSDRSFLGTRGPLELRGTSAIRCSVLGRDRARSPTASYVVLSRETCSALRYFGGRCRCPAQQRRNSRPDACRLRNPAHLICQSRSWLGGPNNALKCAQYSPKRSNAEATEEVFERHLLTQRDQEEEISACLRKSTSRVLSRSSLQ